MSRLFTFLCLSLLFNLAQAQLPTPEYKKGQAILSGTIANYNPDDNLIFKIGAPNIVMGTAETLYPTVEADGSFTINIPLYHSAQVRMIIGNADLVILLSPEKETNVTINLSNLPGKQFVYSGQYATINNEWCQPELITKIPPVYCRHQCQRVQGTLHQPIQTVHSAQQHTVTIQRRHSYTSQSFMRI